MEFGPEPNRGGGRGGGKAGGGGDGRKGGGRTQKWGLLTFSWTEWNRFCTRCSRALWPLIMYLLRPPTAI